MKPGDLLLRVVAMVALVACGILIGYVLWGQQGAPAPVTPTPVPTTTPAPSPTPSQVATPAPSPMGSWDLTAMTIVSGGSSIVQNPTGTITATFTSGGKLTGSGGCNNYGGDYATGGSSLSVTNIVSTLMSCGNVLDTQERAYLGVLGAASTFEADGNTLTIRTGTTPQGKLVFRAHGT